MDPILLIVIVLVILWALGAFAFNVGSLMYIVLVIAVILLIVWLVRRMR